LIKFDFLVRDSKRLALAALCYRPSVYSSHGWSVKNG